MDGFDELKFKTWFREQTGQEASLSVVAFYQRELLLNKIAFCYGRDGRTFEEFAIDYADKFSLMKTEIV